MRFRINLATLHFLPAAALAAVPAVPVVLFQILSLFVPRHVAAFFILCSLGFTPMALSCTWPSRFIHFIARMKTISNDIIHVHYSPELEKEADYLTSVCTEEMNNLAMYFGFNLGSRTAVYILPSIRVVFTLTGGRGWASAARNHIFVSFDSYHEFRQVLRHEMTHIFASKLRKEAPKLNSEGLAGYVETCNLGNGWQIPPRETPAIGSMLDNSYFMDIEHRAICYEAAESFTAFLIRRFGWPVYCEFYRQASCKNYSRTFQQSFGLSLESAEAEWRTGA